HPRPELASVGCREPACRRDGAGVAADRRDRHCEHHAGRRQPPHDRDRRAEDGRPGRRADHDPVPGRSAVDGADRQPARCGDWLGHDLLAQGRRRDIPGARPDLPHHARPGADRRHRRRAGYRDLRLPADARRRTGAPEPGAAAQRHGRAARGTSALVRGGAIRQACAERGRAGEDRRLPPSDAGGPRAGRVRSCVAVLFVMLALSAVAEGLIGDLFQTGPTLGESGGGLDMPEALAGLYPIQLVTGGIGAFLGLVVVLPVLIGRIGSGWANGKLLPRIVRWLVLLAVPVLIGLFGVMVPALLLMFVTFIVVGILYLVLIFLIWLVGRFFPTWRFVDL